MSWRSLGAGVGTEGRAGAKTCRLLTYTSAMPGGKKPYGRYLWLSWMWPSSGRLGALLKHLWQMGRGHGHFLRQVASCSHGVQLLPHREHPCSQVGL